MMPTKTTSPALSSLTRNFLVCASIGAVVASSGCSSGSGSAAPPPAKYQIGGTISGLPDAASGLVLVNDGATLTVDGGATSFSFPTTLAAGTAYAVTVQTSPAGLTCTVAGGSGTLNSNISNVVVTCADKAYSLGGTISGLGSASGLVLANGSDTLRVPAEATTFTMPASVPYTASYEVTVKTQPTGASCAVTPSTPATMPSSNVTSVKVACTDKPYTLGGTVSISAPHGVSLSDMGLVITNSSNGDRFVFTAGATSFTMPKPVDFGASYSLSVTTQPTLLICAVDHPSGVMPAADVSLTVACSDRAFTLSGTVTINAPSGAIVSDQNLVLTNSGNGDTYRFSANAASFTMAQSVPYGSAYAVSVTTQPAGLSCSASNPSTTMPANNVTTIAVTCADQSFTLGGSIGGLGSASGLVLTDNGADQTTILANAVSFNMNTPVPYGASYDVAVSGHPAGVGCAVTDGSGTMPGSAVMSVEVNCEQNTYSSPEDVVVDAAGNLYVADTGDDAVQKILGTSGVEAAIGSGFNIPVGVAIDASGNIYVADTGNDVVKKIVKATGAVVTLGSGFAAPSAVAVDTSGNVYVSDTGNEQVKEISNGATSELSAGYPPAGIAVDASGNLYVADSADNFVVETLSSGLGSAILGTGLSHPRGIAVDSIGNVYVADAGNNAVKEISISGNTFALGSGFSTPSGVGLDANGNVWVADTGHNVITEIPNPNTITGVESVLYSFGASPDGANPYGGLIQASDGNFYGMTYNGGANGNGAVVKITPAGLESVLYSFGNSGDGIEPNGNLIQASDGNFYGMTYTGGANGTGAIIKITPAGAESVLYSFAASGSGDGANPNGNLIQANDGNLYGMTLEGGANGTGAVIEITTTGTESVLYSFGANGTGDGASPWGSLIQASNGILYGMTYAGGTNGTGTMISITLGGTESVLHSLGGSGDGAEPNGNLIQASDGNFYGVTRAGGANGDGAVIKLTPAGAESVLYSFATASYPNGSLIEASDGNFYGLTLGGGVDALGDVFRVTPAGVQSVVYSFGGSGDGEVSYGNLIQANGGSLYAMTTYGGANNKGAVVAVH